MNTSPSPQQILVCDDEPHLREMVAEYLTERGYCVSEAENANVMNDLLEKTQPALIILDVNMPGTDGLTALRNLRTTSTVPVIM
ncbi:response regulator [Roseibium sp.]